MHASVIIPSFNTADCIGRTLECLTKQEASSINWEIIVVDCSENDSVRTITKQYAQVNFLPVKDRFNPGIGRNIGAQKAIGELLIFIDADVELSPTAVFNAVKHHQEGAKIFGGALELNEDKSIGLTSYIEHYFFNHESQKNRPAQARKNLSSAFMCVDKKCFLDEGGFKNIARMQDTELTERLRAKGYQLMFYPDLLGLQTQDSPFDKVKRKIAINGQNLYHIRYKTSITPAKKALFDVILPAMALLKGSRIIARHLIYQSWRNKVRTIYLALPIFYCSALWMIGFYKAMHSDIGISADRD